MSYNVGEPLARPYLEANGPTIPNLLSTHSGFPLHGEELYEPSVSISLMSLSKMSDPCHSPLWESASSSTAPAPLEYGHCRLIRPPQSASPPHPPAERGRS